MKGIGRLSDGGGILLHKRHSLVQSVCAASAAVTQVANVFHVAPEKRGTVVDLRRKVVTQPEALSLFRQTGPGNEPIMRLPKPPDFVVAGPAVVGRARSAQQADCWETGTGTEPSMLPERTKRLRLGAYSC